MNPNAAMAGLTGWTPQSDGLGLGLRQRAQRHRQLDDAAAQDTADALSWQLQDPQIAWNTRLNNAKAAAMTNPQWDSYFQAADEATGGRGFNMMGPAIPGTNQAAGFSVQPALEGLKQSDPMERKRRERLANVQQIDEENNVGPRRGSNYPTL